jgi:hypothetical protein
VALGVSTISLRRSRRSSTLLGELLLSFDDVGIVDDLGLAGFGGFLDFLVLRGGCSCGCFFAWGRLVLALSMGFFDRLENLRQQLLPELAE